MIRRGVIIFEDAHKHRFTVHISGVTSRSALEICVDLLRAKSDAAIISYAYTEEMLLTDGAQGSGAYDCVHQQLRLYYLTDDRPISFFLPAPKEGIVDAHQEATAAIADEIQTMLTVNTSTTGLDYRGGAIVAQAFSA